MKNIAYACYRFSCDHQCQKLYKEMAHYKGALQWCLQKHTRWTRQGTTNLAGGVVTLTATTRAFSRPISWFMQQRSRPATAPSLQRGIDEVSSGRSDGVACRSCCRRRRGWTEIVVADPGGLKRCILRSRCRTGRCEFSARLFFLPPNSCRFDRPRSPNAAP